MYATIFVQLAAARSTQMHEVRGREKMLSWEILEKRGVCRKGTKQGHGSRYLDAAYVQGICRMQD